MHYVHSGEAVVTSTKIDIFMLVTTRPVAHSGRFVCIPNCVGEFGMYTGQPLVIMFAIKRTVLVPGVCPCIRIRSMMHYVRIALIYIEMYIQM